MSFLHALATAGEVASWEPIAAARVVAGDPQSCCWVFYESPAEKLSAGAYAATPGSWRVSYTEWEHVRVISGRCTVTGDDGSAITAGPGDEFVIEPGFTGIWTVTEKLLKHWVIRE